MSAGERPSLSKPELRQLCIQAQSWLGYCYSVIRSEVQLQPEKLPPKTKETAQDFFPKQSLISFSWNRTPVTHKKKVCAPGTYLTLCSVAQKSQQFSKNQDGIKSVILAPIYEKLETRTCKLTNPWPATTTTKKAARISSGKLAQCYAPILKDSKQSQLNGVGAEPELPLTRESYLSTWHPAVSHGFGEYNTT